MKTTWHRMRCVETYRVMDASGTKFELRRGQEYAVTRAHSGMRSVMFGAMFKVPAHVFGRDPFSERETLRRVGAGPLATWVPA